MTTKHEIKALVFDVGGVLEIGSTSVLRGGREYTKEIHEYMAKKFNLSLEQWFKLIEKIHDNSIKRGIARKHLDKLAKLLRTDYRDLENLFLQAYKKYFKLNKELYDFAFKLQKKGYKIVILSNQWYISKKAKVPKNLVRKFDLVVISCDVGIRKPDKDIYKFLLEKLKIEPNKIIFIDDLKRNLFVAKKLGTQTILFKNNKQLFKQLEKFGVKV